MEPISDLVCMIGAIPFQIIFTIACVILGFINALIGSVVIGMIWSWPIMIIAGIVQVLWNLLGIICFPIAIMFGNPFLWVNEILSRIFDVALAGTLPIQLMIISMIAALIKGIIDIIIYAVLTLTCNATGIHLVSTLFQSALSFITM